MKRTSRSIEVFFLIGVGAFGWRFYSFIFFIVSAIGPTVLPDPHSICFLLLLLSRAAGRA